MNTEDYYFYCISVGDELEFEFGTMFVVGKSNDEVYLNVEPSTDGIGDQSYTYADLERLQPAVIKRIPESEIAAIYHIDGNTSDGYHTFNELYHHRAVLFSVICSVYKYRCWKSKQHHDGTMYDGMFIVGIDTPKGQATYHYDIDPYWDMFDVRELDKAPEWDGHTPDQAIERIGSLTNCGGTTVRLVKRGNDTYATKVAGFGEVDCCTKCCFKSDSGDCSIPEGFGGCSMYCRCYYEKLEDGTND